MNCQRRDLTADQRYIIWEEYIEGDDEWQAERQRDIDEANRKRAEAAKEQHTVSKPWAGEAKPGDGAATTCGTTIPPARTADKKAEAAHVDAGTVARISALKASRPDLIQKVRDGAVDFHWDLALIYENPIGGEHGHGCTASRRCR